MCKVGCMHLSRIAIPTVRYIQNKFFSVCPGFGQDRVNFHQNPGRGTPGRLTQPQPGQTEPGIPYHVPSRWVTTGGMAWRELTHSSGARAPFLSGRTALWVVRFVSCFLLICIVVVAVPFICCSVKLPLSRPTSFCLFLSILLRTPAVGGAAAWRFCCRLQPKPEHHSNEK